MGRPNRRRSFLNPQNPAKPIIINNSTTGSSLCTSMFLKMNHTTFTSNKENFSTPASKVDNSLANMIIGPNFNKRQDDVVMITSQARVVTQFPYSNVFLEVSSVDEYPYKMIVVLQMIKEGKIDKDDMTYYIKLFRDDNLAMDPLEKECQSRVDGLMVRNVKQIVHYHAEEVHGVNLMPRSPKAQHRRAFHILISSIPAGKRLREDFNGRRLQTNKEYNSANRDFDSEIKAVVWHFHIPAEYYINKHEVKLPYTNQHKTYTKYFVAKEWFKDFNKFVFLGLKTDLSSEEVMMPNPKYDMTVDQLADYLKEDYYFKKVVPLEHELNLLISRLESLKAEKKECDAKLKEFKIAEDGGYSLKMTKGTKTKSFKSRAELQTRRDGLVDNIAELSKMVEKDSQKLEDFKSEFEAKQEYPTLKALDTSTRIRSNYILDKLYQQALCEYENRGRKDLSAGFYANKLDPQKEKERIDDIENLENDPIEYDKDTELEQFYEGDDGDEEYDIMAIASSRDKNKYFSGNLSVAAMANGKLPLTATFQSSSKATKSLARVGKALANGAMIANPTSSEQTRTKASSFWTPNEGSSAMHAMRADFPEMLAASLESEC